MNRTFKITGFVACFVAVLALSGAQWMALQSYAWLRMTVQFSQQETLGKALAKTFSGRYPCALCLKVQKGIQQDQEQEQKTPGLNSERMPEVIWELRCLTAPPIPTHPIENVCFASCFYSDFSDSPPTPPPRV